MEQYLTTNELSARIKMTPGTIRNLVWKKELIEGIHYLRPTPRKLLFKWTVMECWLHGSTVDPTPMGKPKQRKPNCLINI